MKNKTWIKLHRKIRQNPLWYSEPLTKAQAWVDLLLIANRFDGFIYVRGAKVEVKRGQVGYSEVKLGELWKWSRGKVRRFLNDLKMEQQIVQQTDNRSTVITICNYDTYQLDEFDYDTADDTSDSTANGQQTVQQTDSRQYTNKERNKERKKEYILKKPDSVSEQTWNDFLTHRKIKKAPLTQTALNGFIKQAENAGWSLEEAIKETIERGWRGFKADWVENKNQNNKFDYV